MKFSGIVVSAPVNTVPISESSWDVQPFRTSHSTAPVKAWGAHTPVNVKNRHGNSISAHDFLSSARSHPTDLPKPVKDGGGWIFQRWVWTAAVKSHLTDCSQSTQLSKAMDSRSYQQHYFLLSETDWQMKATPGSTEDVQHSRWRKPDTGNLREPRLCPQMPCPFSLYWGSVSGSDKQVEFQTQGKTGCAVKLVEVVWSSS